MSALPAFFSSLKISHATCCNAAASVLRKVRVSSDESKYKHIKYSKDCKEALFSSIEVSENLGHPYVGVEHILIAILEQNNKLVQQFLIS